MIGGVGPSQQHLLGGHPQAQILAQQQAQLLARQQAQLLAHKQQMSGHQTNTHSSSHGPVGGGPPPHPGGPGAVANHWQTNTGAPADMYYQGGGGGGGRTNGVMGGGAVGGASYGSQPMNQGQGFNMQGVYIVMNASTWSVNPSNMDSF